MKNLLKKLTIVLTDDDEDDRDFFRDALRDLKIDCHLHLLGNGVELINHLNNAANEMPDIVFLDLNMPVMSGLKSLEEIRKDERFKKIPIIVIYSTSSHYQDKEKSLHYGANAYITKPNDFSDLKKLLYQVIQTDWQAKSQKTDNEAFVITL